MNDRHKHTDVVSAERIGVAQIGARRHYAVPRALNSKTRLAALYTDFYWPDRLEDSVAAKIFPRFSGRRANALSSRLVHSFPGFYLQRLLQRRLVAKGGREAELRQWLVQNQQFGRQVCSASFERNADCIYAFNGAALEIFEHAREHGLATVLDQTTPALSFEENIVAEECQRWPGWETPRSYSPGREEILQISIEREKAEWQLSDRVICGSKFAARTLMDGVPSDRVFVVPYPSPAKGSSEQEKVQPPQCHDGPLRVLFAGTLGLRKGLPWLIEAVAACEGAIDLRLVGPSQLLPEKMSELAGEADLRGAVSRSEMRRHYHWADVVVLPSLSEGSANVCHEAMAAARAVITTPNAGSLVRDGIDGRVVPVRDAVALSAALSECLENPSLVAEWGANALQRGSEFTFDRYADTLLRAIRGETDSLSSQVERIGASLPNSDLILPR